MSCYCCFLCSSSKELPTAPSKNHIVSVHVCCCDKTPQARWCTKDKFMSYGAGGWQSKIKCCQFWGLVRDLVSGCVPRGCKGQRARSTSPHLVLLKVNWSHSWGQSAQDSVTSQRPHLFSPVTSGVIVTMIWEGTAHHSICASCMLVEFHRDNNIGCHLFIFYKLGCSVLYPPKCLAERATGSSRKRGDDLRN
jgi:hypothetical protein